jgi:hypothetical protein
VGGGFWRANADGSSSKKLASGTASGHIAIQGNAGYFADHVYLATLDVNCDSGGEIIRVDLTTGKSTQVAASQSRVSGMATDDTNVYWTSYCTGKVMKLPL